MAFQRAFFAAVLSAARAGVSDARLIPKRGLFRALQGTHDLAERHYGTGVYRFFSANCHLTQSTHLFISSVAASHSLTLRKRLSYISLRYVFRVVKGDLQPTAVAVGSASWQLLGAPHCGGSEGVA